MCLASDGKTEQGGLPRSCGSRGAVLGARNRLALIQGQPHLTTEEGIVTPQQRAQVTTTIIDECLRRSGGDKEAGLDAARFMLAHLPDAELERFLPVWRNEFGATVGPGGTALSLDVQHQMGLLMELDAALAQMNARNGAALAILNRADEEPATALLWGAATATVDPTYGYGLPEVGSPGSGALQTAKERPKGRKGTRGKSKVKGKPKRPLTEAEKLEAATARLAALMNRRRQP